MPLTGKGKVHMIVTELAVFHVTLEGLILSEVAFGVDVDGEGENSSRANCQPTPKNHAHKSIGDEFSDYS